MDLEKAQKKILNSIKHNNMCVAVGECYVEYEGRASSKLPRGKRMLLIKGDSSFAIHENRLIRPTNYMMGASIGCELDEKKDALKILETILNDEDLKGVLAKKLLDAQNR